MLKPFNRCARFNRSLHWGPGADSAGDESSPCRDGMASPTPVYSPALDGVFAADPESPPVPPAGAQAIVVRDTAGRVIAYAWVVQEHADEWWHTAAWDYHEFRKAFNRSPGPSLRLEESADPGAPLASPSPADPGSVPRPPVLRLAR